MLFDTTNGDLRIPPAVLRADQSLAEAVGAGWHFVREFDMKTGWVFRTAAPRPIADHLVQLSLGYKDDHLRRVSLGFADVPSADEGERFRQHTEFLQRELGAPSTVRPREVRYDYAWGSISSESDPRGGGSFIQVNWNDGASADGAT